MIIVNTKSYLYGKKLEDFIKKINSKKIIFCVPNFEISKLSKHNIFAQHIDTNDKKNSAGFSSPKLLSSLKIKGSLINHSSHKIKTKTLLKTIKKAKEYNIKTIVCVDSLKGLKKIMKAKPYAIAYEEKRLIGTKKSITEFEQKKVKKFASIVKKTDIVPLCGAGIHSPKDISMAIDLGCDGVLISSAIVFSKNPKKLAQKMLQAEKLAKE